MRVFFRVLARYDRMHGRSHCTLSGALMGLWGALGPPGCWV